MHFGYLLQPTNKLPNLLRLITKGAPHSGHTSSIGCWLGAISLLFFTYAVIIPDVDTSWEFSSSMLDTDDEKMSCIFGSKITAVNELTITAKEKPIDTIYLTLMVVHI